MLKNWDIFCRVIDNFGDIGICWRLARQLAGEYGLSVRLWVDDTAAFAALCPEADPALAEQELEGVRVGQWTATFPAVNVADAVIEAFACELPETYKAAMAARTRAPVWINLEYLSAEDWIEECHALASPHPPLVKHFFFPGFTSRSGGLLRERDLPAPVTLPPDVTGRALQISLFCYETAPVASLLDAWAASGEAIRCRVPPGQPLAAVRQHLGGEGPWRRGSLVVEPVPFLPQSDYDRLLAGCDVNFVRGEDSFVRAQWMAAPFVWQAYPQADGAHLAKLAAFLTKYGEAMPEDAAVAVHDFWQAWNGSAGVAAAWPALRTALPALRAHNLAWRERLQGQPDLARNLVEFCTSRL